MAPQPHGVDEPLLVTPAEPRRKPWWKQWPVWGYVALVLALLVVLGLISWHLASGGSNNNVSPPQARKSAAATIVYPNGNQSTLNNPVLVIWSGKTHGHYSVADDLYMFDLKERSWSTTNAVGDRYARDETDNSEFSSPPATEDQDGEGDAAYSRRPVTNLNADYEMLGSNDNEGLTPLPRWKEIAVRHNNGLLVYGGDALGHFNISGEERRHIYLGDVWQLTNISISAPEWVRAFVLPEDDPEVHPSPRRAAAGALARGKKGDVLYVHGGRNHKGQLLDDLWALDLTLPTIRWTALWDPEQGIPARRNLLEDLDCDDDDDRPGCHKHDRDHDHDDDDDDDDDDKKKHKKHHHQDDPDDPKPEPRPDPPRPEPRPDPPRPEPKPKPDPKPEPKEPVQPETRKGHSIVHIPGKHPFVLLWGGRSDETYFNDMWAFDLDAREWREWTDEIKEGPAPHARDHHSAIYLDGRMVIYGGRGGKDYESAEALGDMWEFDVDRREWHELRANGTAPVPRFLNSLADFQTEEGHTRLVVFGGEGPFGCYLNDVWEFNPRNVTWTNLSGLDLTQAGCMDKLAGDDDAKNTVGRKMIDF